VSRQLIEISVDAIIAKLKADLPAELATIRSARADNLVTMEAPRDYYVYPRAKGYRTPAVFVIGDRIDFQKDRKGANHVNAAVRINISFLVEDKDAERLVRKSYRYQAAVHKVLDQATLTSPEGSARMTLVIQNAAFSGLYSNLEPGDPQAVYRQEISLEVDCFQYEP
jgi:hypothetical protein